MDDPRCFSYRLEDRNGSAADAAAWPGVPAAVRQLGYASVHDFEVDARNLVEPIMALSTFCLTPPGDTPKRRGLIDAWTMGCVPVVFQEESRDLGLFLTPDEARNMSVKLDAKVVLDGKAGELSAALEAAAPPAEVARMRAAALATVTRLHWAYSDLGEEDHAKVGPDAWDVLLYQLNERKTRKGKHR